MAKLDPEIKAVLDGLAQSVQHALTHSTQTAERLTNGIINSVLEVATRTIPAAPNNFVTLDYGSTIGAVEIFNHGTYVMTVAAGGTGVQPQGGTGVSRIEPGTGRTININSRTAVIYGTPGDVVGYQAFTRGTLGRTSIMAVDGGAP